MEFSLPWWSHGWGPEADLTACPPRVLIPPDPHNLYPGPSQLLESIRPSRTRVPDCHCVVLTEAGHPRRQTVSRLLPGCHDSSAGLSAFPRHRHADRPGPQRQATPPSPHQADRGEIRYHLRYILLTHCKYWIIACLVSRKSLVLWNPSDSESFGASPVSPTTCRPSGSLKSSSGVFL